MAIQYGSVVNPFTGDLDMVALPTLLPISYALSSVGNTGATETNLINITIPANYRGFTATNIGTVIEVDAGGILLQALTTNTRRLRVYVAGPANVRGTLVLDTGALNVAVNSAWAMKLRIYNATNGVGAGTLRVGTEILCKDFSGSVVQNSYTSVSATLSSAWSIIITGQSAGTTANNQITSEWMKSYYIGT